MNTLIINCGSSSVKFRVYRMPDEQIIIQGKAEKFRSGNTVIRIIAKEKEFEKTTEGFSYQKNIKTILGELVNPANSCLYSLNDIDIVGHRLIHNPEGGESCMEITNDLISYMKSSIPLAPMHYPANLEGIRVISQLIPGVLQAGVFDSAFYHTLPPKAILYGIPIKWYKDHQIRRYGFHGISHKYASQRSCEITRMNFYKSRIVSCHLGNGSSLTAIKNGMSVDTSMGMTPAEGLLMGTRCGDIDPGIIVYLLENFNLSSNDIQRLINKEGGLLGLSGVSSDYRAVEKASDTGNKNAKSGLDVYHYRIKKYIGAYMAVLGGMDILVFTGGIGENSSRVREEVCSGLESLGIHLSIEHNRLFNGKEAVISKDNSKVRVVVVPANEELVIAREVVALAKIKNGKNK